MGLISCEEDKSDLGSKRPRLSLSVIAWEAQNLTNDFVDISRVALDDRYGKVGASLYKRRNGSGPTDGSTPGLFGISGLATYDSKELCILWWHRFGSDFLRHSRLVSHKGIPTNRTTRKPSLVGQSQQQHCLNTTYSHLMLDRIIRSL